MRLTITADHGRYSWTIPWQIFEVFRSGFQTLTIPVSAVYTIEIVGAGMSNERPGVKIVGTFALKKEQKITVALGQIGNHLWLGTGQVE